MIPVVAIQKKSQGKRKVALSIEIGGSRCFETKRKGAARRILAIRLPSSQALGRAGEPEPVLPKVGGCLLKGSSHTRRSTSERTHARSRFEDSSAVSESRLSVTGRLSECG